MVKGSTCAIVGVLLAQLAAGTAYAEVTTLWVAPTAQGTGSGASRGDAAYFKNDAFWNTTVRNQLEATDVTVRFVNGIYAGEFNVPYNFDRLGNDTHLLTIQGESVSGVILKQWLRFLGCKKIKLYVLNWKDMTDDYALQITSATGGVPSHDIYVCACTWKDLPIRVGAAGVSHGSYNVSFRYCAWARIGVNGGSHPIYNYDDAHHLTVDQCDFENSYGAYVRFRDNVDYCDVTRCTFISTADAFNMPFIHMPAISDGDPVEDPWEYLGTHYLTQENLFMYSSRNGTYRFPIYFSHTGQNPPGVHYLMTAEEGAILEEGSAADRKSLLANNNVVDWAEIKLADNTYVDHRYKAAFGSFGGYGAIPEWSGIVAFHDLLNHRVPISWTFTASEVSYDFADGSHPWQSGSVQSLKEAGWIVNAAADSDSSFHVDTSGSGLVWLKDLSTTSTPQVSKTFTPDGLSFTQGQVVLVTSVSGATPNADIRVHSGSTNLFRFIIYNDSTLRVYETSGYTEYAYPAGTFAQDQTFTVIWTVQPDGQNGKATFTVGTTTVVSDHPFLSPGVGGVPNMLQISVGSLSGANKLITIDEIEVTNLAWQ